MFGAQLIGAFAEFKRIFDPDSMMNPGVIVAPHPLDSDLRVTPSDSPRLSRRISTSPPRADLQAPRSAAWGSASAARASAARCARRYMATRDEMHSTRGRAHLLWEALNGKGLLQGGLADPALKEALELCLSCKACKTECPTNVDLATYKAEFLSHYYEGRSRPLHAYAFGLINRWARMASHTPRLANALGSFPLTAGLAKSPLHIAPQRRLPEFATRTFGSRAADLQRLDEGARGSVAAKSDARGAKADVLLWADTFTNYFQPRIAEAAHQVLSDAGFKVKVLQRRVLLRAAAVRLRHARQGEAVPDDGDGCPRRRNLHRDPDCSIEPSCASVFRDEAVNLLPDDPRTARLKRQTMLLSEFLGRNAPDYAPAKTQQKVLVHMHCHHRAIFNMKDEVAVLNATGGEVKVLDSGCCAAWPGRSGSSRRATLYRRRSVSACCCRRFAPRSPVR